MGCSSSRPTGSVAPAPVTPDIAAVASRTPPPTPGTGNNVDGSARAAAILDRAVTVGAFIDDATSALDTLAAAPDAVINFSQALQENAADLKDALCAIVGAASVAASVVASMTPAAVIAAPALAAVRALAAQLGQMRENIGLAENLRAELAYADTLLLHAGRSELLAKDHAALLNVICGAARNAGALVTRISRRGAFMSFVAAGADGGKLRDALSQLHDRFTALGTAAAVAGAAGIAELPALLVDKLKASLRGDDVGDAAPSRLSRRAPLTPAASPSPDSCVALDTAQSAEISEGRLSVDWGTPSLLDHGGVNDVYAGVLFSSEAVATDEPGSGIPVALRVLRGREGGAGAARRDFAAVRRFLRDARLQMRLASTSGCVTPLGVCVLGGGRVALVQARMACSLRDVLRTRSLAPRTGLRVALAVCDAVSELHAFYPSIVHGDLKLSNVLLTAEGDPRLLSNVGSAEGDSSDDVADSDSAGYLSPELLTPPATGGRPSRASDVWAAATLVVAILSRVPPFAHLVVANEAYLKPGGASSTSSLVAPLVADLRISAQTGGPPYAAAQLADLLPDSSGAVSGGSGVSSLQATLQRCWLREPADRPDVSELADALHAALVSAGGDPRAPAAVPVQQALVDAMAAAAAAARAAVPSEARRLALQGSAASRRGSGDPGPRAENSAPVSRGDDGVAGDPAASPNDASSHQRAAKVVTVPWGGRTYFFRGEQYWRAHASGSTMDAGYPLSIAGQWGVPGPIDASLEWHSMTYFFCGHHYYRLNAAGSAPDAGYPLPILREWGVPGPVDAAFIWRGKGYTFHGTEYYRLNDAGLRESGPHSIENDWGVPGPIDSALAWGGRCYFFKGAYYWRLNDACNAPDAGYPLLTEALWGLPSA